jgi:hypothetical protein
MPAQTGYTIAGLNVSLTRRRSTSIMASSAHAPSKKLSSIMPMAILEKKTLISGSILKVNHTTKRRHTVLLHGSQRLDQIGIGRSRW